MDHWILLALQRLYFVKALQNLAITPPNLPRCIDKCIKISNRLSGITLDVERFSKEGPRKLCGRSTNIAVLDGRDCAWRSGGVSCTKLVAEPFRARGC